MKLKQLTLAALGILGLAALEGCSNTAPATPAAPSNVPVYSSPATTGAPGAARVTGARRR